MTEPQGDLTPIAPSRVHRFARTISELRDRRIGGSRKEIQDAINPLIESGKIDRAEYERFVAQLGLG